ncbi:MAG: BCR family protein [Gammaproteobacteria bacterium]
MIENKLINIVEPLVQGNGCELWGIDLIRGKTKPIFRIYIDAIGGATIEDCEKVSNDINFELPADTDFIDLDYVLEVSTPGLERKFFTIHQMKDYLGQKVLIKIKENNQLFHGKKILTLVDVIEENVILEDDLNNSFTVPFNTIHTCNLSPDYQVLLREKNEKH